MTVHGHVGKSFYFTWGGPKPLGDGKKGSSTTNESLSEHEVLGQGRKLSLSQGCEKIM